MEKFENEREYLKEMIQWRRDIHMHPELGFEVFRTSDLVARQLASFGLEVRRDFAKTAVLGVLRTGKAGKTIGLRADMDALAIPDLKQTPYKSRYEGCCHACGHDAHTALLLGLAHYFSRHIHEINGTIKFVFQPAEEGPEPGGASLIMDSGEMDDVDRMLGAHVQPLYPVGQIAVRYGPAFAQGSFFQGKVTGEGCHGAHPQRGRDPIIAVAQIVQAIQNIRSKELPPWEPAVISVCSLNSGRLETQNVIPDEATFGGTFRTFEKGTSILIAKRMEEIIKGICDANQCGYEFTSKTSYPSFCNHSECVDAVCHAAKELLGEENVILKQQPEMGAEDFAYYARKIPSVFFFFGVGNKAKKCVYGCHTSLFDMDENAFLPAMAVMIRAVRELSRNPVCGLGMGTDGSKKY